ncbi:MAG: hypothetical protein M3288_01215 [Thermoproteota archaeon]|nr:hypothetical protein [Thermoproteota archaeon]
MNATTTIIANQDPITNDGKISKQVKFVLCSHCFWNASLLGREVGRICPACKGSTINSMPLARNVRDC